MNAIEIVIKYLKENGYDGLVNPGEECGCGIDDLAPCDSCFGQCEPAYYRTCDCPEYDGHHYQIVKPEKK